MSFCIELFCVVTLQYQILVRIAIAYFIIEKKESCATALAGHRAAILFNLNLTKECDCMKRQLQGIALILVSILLMLGYGNVAFFDLSFKWALIFSVIGITGVIMTFLPDKK